jgi:uncharacterized protein
MEKTLPINQGWLRALLFFFVSAFISGVITSFVETLIFRGFLGSATINAFTLPFIYLNYCINQLGVLLCIWFFRYKIDKNNIYSLGLNWKQNGGDAFVGLVVSATILIIALLILGNQIEIKQFDLQIGNLAIFFLLYLTVAFIEEIMIRGYVLNNLLQSVNKGWALVISSVAFSMLHLGNPEITPLALINIFIAGLLLGINYIYTKNLWFGIFLHFSWNFIQGPILGFPVSGTQKDMGISKQLLHGPDLITGGDFGFEASLFSPILQLIAVIILALIYEKRIKRQRKEAEAAANEANAESENQLEPNLVA